MENLILFFFLIFSVVIHEYSHGLAAYHNGDDTAYLMGRLTLNPIAHLDPIGSVILPLFLALTIGVPFGYAKPVPINPLRFRDYHKGIIIVSIAGCIANFIAGFIFALISGITRGLISQVFELAAFINFILCFFNLIPIPPLDGSRLIAVLLPRTIGDFFNRIERYGIFIIYALVFAGAFRFLVPFCSSLVNHIADIAHLKF
ncbi:MAG: site-2 protease family protein [Candidatus Omnitrophica bacterium]|nr:site-2 protease family protein [Candidatus Omnitrophota bacterium]MCM8788294.1 site-2 protease family protein [Candidatus Omnitrophota bacterium]